MSSSGSYLLWQKYVPVPLLIFMSKQPLLPFFFDAFMIAATLPCYLLLLPVVGLMWRVVPWGQLGGSNSKTSE